MTNQAKVRGVRILCVVFFALIGFNQIPVRATAPPSPDLIITDVWPVGGQLHYQIQNIGSATAASGHVTALWVDGVQMDTDYIPNTLSPGERLNRTFLQYSWVCSQTADTIAAIADSNTIIFELNENNNQRAENWLCDTNAPVITSGPKATLITQSSATITWDTDEASDSKVMYGTRTGLFAFQASNPTLVTSHSITLSGLSPHTTYNYVVESRDAVGNSVTSAVDYFSTAPSNAGIDPTITFLATTGQHLPMEFSAEAQDNEDIDHMVFYLNNELVLTDFSSPFRYYFSPSFLDMTAAEFYQDHEIEAQAYAPLGNMDSSEMWWGPSGIGCMPVELDFGSPCDACVDIVLTDGPVVPPLEWEYRVSIFASEEVWEERDTEWGTFVSGTPVERIEFYVDDMVTPVLVEYETTFLNEDWDPVGLTVGEHTLVAKAYAHDCLFPRTDTHTLVIREYVPEVTIRNRFVSPSGDGNTFNVRIQIKNHYLAPITLDRLIDDVSCFYVLEDANADYSVSSAYSWDDKKCHVEIDFEDAVTIGFLGTYEVEYTMVPILSPGFEDHRVGSEGIVLTFDDPDGTSHDVNRVILKSGLMFREDVLDATQLADYLIVTNPRNLFGIYPDGEVQTLLDKMAELAAAKQGVLGFANADTVFGSTVGLGDKLAAGRVLSDDFHVNGEMVLLETEISYIKIYGGEGFLRRFEHPGLHSSDDVAVGDVMDVDDPITHGFFANGDEIILADGEGADLGRISIFQFWKNDDLFSEVNHFSSTYRAGSRVATGNFSSMWVPADDDDEIVVAHGAGYIDIYHEIDGTWYTALSFSTVFNAGDGFAVGNVIQDSWDEFIIGDKATDRIYVYDSDADARWFDYDLNDDDQILVGDFWDDDQEEIVVVSPIRGEIDFISCAAPGVTGISTTIVDTWTPLMFTIDLFACADIFGLEKEELVIGHTVGREGEVHVFSDSGDPSLSADAIDALLDEGGEWAEKMEPGWATSGHLLLVGETEILPAFSRYFDLRWSSPTADYTDCYYADANDDLRYPELAIGRIIGNNPERLVKPIQASLDLHNGICTLENDFAAVASGHASGSSGTSDEIDFVPERNSVDSRLTDDGFVVVEMHEPTEAEFFSHTAYRDIIHLAGHGNRQVWDDISSGEVDDQFLTDDNRPFVFGSSCLTGRYLSNYSLAEAFLDNNASSYCGATESTRHPYHKWLATRFYDEIDPGVTLGECLRNAKNNVIGAGGWEYEEEYETFVSVLQHFYGDPKLEVSFTASKTKQRPQRPEPTLTVESATRATVNVPIPQYVVTTNDGIDTVEIPGGSALLEPDQAQVPEYTRSWTFVGGMRVQDVALTQQGGLSTTSGLELSLVVPVLPGTQADVAATTKRAPAGEEWWPDQDFAWHVVDSPDGSSTLFITIYPFFYNANTTEAMFYNDYYFDLTTNVPQVEITSLDTDKTAYGSGETVHGELYMSVPQQSSVLIEASILRGDADPVDGLPLRLLNGVTGMISCAFDWDGTGFDPDHYLMQVWVRDLDGMVLATRSCSFNYGRAVGEMTDLSISPACFEVGDAVDFSAAFRNAGDSDISGTIVFEIQDADHVTLAQVEQPVTDLAPGNTQTMEINWSNATHDRIDCQIFAYTHYFGTTTHHLVETPQIPGDLNLDSKFDALDLATLANHQGIGMPQGDDPFLACATAADVNRDGTVDVQDLDTLGRLLIQTQ